jgi:hypothetical protein
MTVWVEGVGGATASNPQMEWDQGAYSRKFHQTLAFIQIGENLPSWSWVAAIADNLLVYDNPRGNPIGQVLCQCYKGEPQSDTDKYPIIQMFYKNILPGAYWAKDMDHMYYLTKRHLKSYKIGLSDETFNVRIGNKNESNFSRVNKQINLDAPIDHYHNLGFCEVFTQKVVRIGTDLFADGDSIGFMENNVCMLRHKNFYPLISPLLEDRWQIES